MKLEELLEQAEQITLDDNEFKSLLKEQKNILNNIKELLKYEKQYLDNINHKSNTHTKHTSPMKTNKKEKADKKTDKKSEKPDKKPDKKSDKKPDKKPDKKIKKSTKKNMNRFVIVRNNNPMREYYYFQKNEKSKK